MKASQIHKAIVGLRTSFSSSSSGTPGRRKQTASWRVRMLLHLIQHMSWNLIDITSVLGPFLSHIEVDWLTVHGG